MKVGTEHFRNKLKTLQLQLITSWNDGRDLGSGLAGQGLGNTAPGAAWEPGVEGWGELLRKLETIRVRLHHKEFMRSYQPKLQETLKNFKITFSM